jgi:hypothetical protein
MSINGWLGDHGAGSLAGLKVLQPGLQLFCAPELPDGLQPDQPASMDRFGLDGARLPTASGSKLR